MKTLLLTLILLFCFSKGSEGVYLSQAYPNFDNNPNINEMMKKQARPYLLPLKHPARKKLNKIFKKTRAIQNKTAFINAGFKIIPVVHTSYMILAKHPSIPGYLFKVYLDTELRSKDTRKGWEELIDRCKGAENIRKFIKIENIQHFVVPSKYLYPVPFKTVPILLTGQILQPFMLVVKDMQLVSKKESKKAWKQKVKKKHLDELYKILTQGYASAYLAENIPYTKNRKFACVDTEYVKRKICLENVFEFLSEEMGVYWNQLINFQPQH